MNSLSQSYNKILEVLRTIEPNENFLNQIRKPKLSDIELIALDICAEYMSIDSECQLFRNLPESISSKIERSVYNRRRRGLLLIIEGLRKQMARIITANEDYLVIDSMPLEVCKLTRSSRAKVCKENFDTAPDKGFCASQNTWFYGYKLHAVCNIQGVFQSFDLTKASVHDVHYLKDVQTQFSNAVLMGDKGYINAEIKTDLFNYQNITLETPQRTNQKKYKPQAFVFKKYRKRIETLFSQLCDQFMIRRNYAKSFNGFSTRMTSKITALTVIQLINKQLNRNINNLKINIA